MEKRNKYKYGVIIIGLLTLGLSMLYLTKEQGNATAFIPNAKSGDISIVNTEENRVIETIEVGDSTSHGIAITPDKKKLYTGNLEKGEVYIYDMETKGLIKKINTGRNLHGIDITPDGQYLYVTSGWTDKKEEYNYINIIDTEKDKIVKTIKSDESSPAHIDFSKNSKYAYVVNVMGNSVSIVDVDNKTIDKVIDVGVMPNEAELSPDNKYLYVANVQSGTISVIDLDKKKLIDNIEAGEGTHGVAVSNDGKQVWTTNMYSNDVSVIDIEKREVIKSIKTNGIANHISIVPKKNRVYVTNKETNNITVIDTKTYEIISEIKVGDEPHEIDFIL